MPSGVDGASLFCNVWLVLSDCDSGLNNYIFLSIVVVVRNMGYTGTKNLFLENDGLFFSIKDMELN